MIFPAVICVFSSIGMMLLTVLIAMDMCEPDERVLGIELVLWNFILTVTTSMAAFLLGGRVLIEVLA